MTDLIARYYVAKISKELAANPKKDPRILENAKYGTLLAYDLSLELKTAKGETATLQWNDVKEIHAFKRDLVTSDLICLTFVPLQGQGLEINEEMAGYFDLQPWLQIKFPEIQAGWVLDSPAFETNHKVIWKRTTHVH
jgi:hypothetical protein